MPPAVLHAELAALGLDHPAGDVAGVLAGQPGDQRATLLGSIASKPPSGLAIVSAKAASVIRVRAAGARALTVTPYRPSSAAATSVSPAMPALAAE